jgi:outer membrane biosynthesis protein TonB
MTVRQNKRELNVKASKNQQKMQNAQMQNAQMQNAPMQNAPMQNAPTRRSQKKKSQNKKSQNKKSQNKKSQNKKSQNNKSQNKKSQNKKSQNKRRSLRQQRNSKQKKRVTKQKRRQRGGYLEYSELPKMLNPEGKLIWDVESTKDYGIRGGTYQGSFLEGAEVGSSPESKLSTDKSVVEGRDANMDKSTTVSERVAAEKAAKAALDQRVEARATAVADNMVAEKARIGKLISDDREYHDGLLSQAANDYSSLTDADKARVVELANNTNRHTALDTAAAGEDGDADAKAWATGAKSPQNFTPP